MHIFYSSKNEIKKSAKFYLIYYIGVIFKNINISYIFIFNCITTFIYMFVIKSVNDAYLILLHITNIN